MKTTEFRYVAYIAAPMQRVWEALVRPEFTRKYWGHEAAAAGGEGRAGHLGERAVVIAGKDDDGVALAVVVEGVSVAGGAGTGRARPGELADAERRRDEERENVLHDAFPPWLVLVDEIAPGVDVRGAVAKFTLKRLHQMVTAR